MTGRIGKRAARRLEGTGAVFPTVPEIAELSRRHCPRILLVPLVPNERIRLATIVFPCAFGG